MRLHKVYVFRDNGKCNHGIVFNNIVTANTIFRCKNPAIALTRDLKSEKNGRMPEISPNYFYLNQKPDQTDRKLLAGKFLDGSVYRRNKMFFTSFESETKKVFFEGRTGNVRKIVSCVKKKRPR